MSSFVKKCCYTTLVLSLLGTLNLAIAYDYSVQTEVGKISTSGTSPGANNFTRVNNVAFPNCTTSPTVMWSDPNNTSDGKKTVLAALLTAKALGRTVNVYYHVDGSGYCRYEIVEVN